MLTMHSTVLDWLLGDGTCLGSLCYLLVKHGLRERCMHLQQASELGCSYELSVTLQKATTA